MVGRSIVALLASSMVVLSCSRAANAPAPAPSATTAGNTPGPAPRRVPPSRDSLAKLRAAWVTQVMASIAGRENQPAEQVFKNVQALKGLTAAQLVHKMDDFGMALGFNCTNCHRLAPQGNFASDTSTDKKRARFMIGMTDSINKSFLPRLYPKDTPKVSCMTCHRGYGEIADVEIPLPERGKPGGPPIPTRPPSH